MHCDQRTDLSRTVTVSSSETRWRSLNCRSVRFEWQASAFDLDGGFPVGFGGDDFAVAELKSKLADGVKSRIGQVVAIAVDALAFSPAARLGIISMAPPPRTR